MLPAEDVLQGTGHPVGGVCLFGLRRAIRVFVDVTLRTFDVVLPAAGAPNAALRIDPARLAALVHAEWVDVDQSKPEGWYRYRQTVFRSAARGCLARLDPLLASAQWSCRSATGKGRRVSGAPKRMEVR